MNDEFSVNIGYVENNKAILGAVSLFGLKNLILSEAPYFTKINLIAILLSFFISLTTIKFFLDYIKKPLKINKKINNFKAIY